MHESALQEFAKFFARQIFLLYGTYRTQKVTEMLNIMYLSMHFDFFLLFDVIKAGLYMHDEPYCVFTHNRCQWEDSSCVY